MRYADMNERQKKAFRNIVHATDWLIGGLENTMSDAVEDSKEYRVAEEQLNDHDGLVAEIYRMATTELYGEGSCLFGKDVEKMIKDIRFCGKEWLMERIERRVAKMGY